MECSPCGRQYFTICERLQGPCLRRLAASNGLYSHLYINCTVIHQLHMHLSHQLNILKRAFLNTTVDVDVDVPHGNLFGSQERLLAWLEVVSNFNIYCVCGEPGCSYLSFKNFLKTPPKQTFYQ